MWVARSFREEHRQALDWLNEHTDPDTRFFGVVVKALRVADSPPAPLLELVAKPNDWQKTVRTATTGQLTVDQNRYREFSRPLHELFARERARLAVSDGAEVRLLRCQVADRQHVPER